MSDQRPVRSPSLTHNNPDLMVWACFVAGGYERWIDVEELYLKAFELGPARLSWRTRPDLPDYKKCAKALQEIEDPKRSDHLGLLLKQGQYTRKLSDAGLTWCTTHQSLLTTLYGAGTVAYQKSSSPAQAISVLEKSDAFRTFLETRSLIAEEWILAEALQCLPSSGYEVWMARLDALNAAALKIERQDIADFVRAARKQVSLNFKR